MRGHIRVKHIYICLNEDNFLKISSRYHGAKKVQSFLQGDLMAIKKSNFACIYMRNITQYDSGERCGPWASCCYYPVTVSEQIPPHMNIRISLLIKVFRPFYSFHISFFYFQLFRPEYH
jgi:hypothetical protein